MTKEKNKSITTQPIKDISKQVDKQTVSTTTVKRRIPFFEWGILLCIAGFACLTFLVEKNLPFLGIDLIVTRSIQSINNEFFDFLMRLLTSLGNPTLGTAMVIVFTLLIAIFWRVKDAAILVVSSVGVGILSVILKTLVARPRPDPEIINQIGHFARADSFPSGHVLYYLGFYGFLTFLIYSKLKDSRMRDGLLGFFLILIILAGVSRIYLGAHWFSDTLGSYLIGTVWLYLMIHLYKLVTK